MSPRVESTPPGAYVDENAASLANMPEILLPCLEAVPAKTIVEIGSYEGDTTRVLLEWARTSGARIVAIEPAPPPELLELHREHPELELVAEPSLEALPRLPIPDVVVIDGDHNYYTVSEELRLIGERATGVELPLLVFHDIGWPLARRDAYYAPERIPEEHRQPLARDVALLPWEPGVSDGGMPFDCVAEREGGPRNGVLTAVEDFMAERTGLRLATVPMFFGVGFLWHEEAPYADSLTRLLAPWDRDPVLQRLEANRVAHMAIRWRHEAELEAASEQLAEVQERASGQERLLRKMLDSRAFSLSERISRLRQRGEPVFSREQVKRALGEGDRSG